MIQRRLGLPIPVVEVFSNDPRLTDLADLGQGRARRRLTLFVFGVADAARHTGPRQNDEDDGRSRATMGGMSRISRRVAAIDRVGHPRGRRQGQGAEGGGRGRHRLRRRRARLPDARRTSSRRRSRRAATRATTTTRRRRACPSCAPRSRTKTKRDSGVRRRGRAGARHQRRQARGLQHVPGAARPRRRGAAARAVLDHVSRGDHARRRRAGRAARPPRRPVPRHGRAARGRAHAAHEGAAVRVAEQPDRRGVPAGRGRGDRPLGASSTASGSSPTRSTSTSPTATHEFSSMPALVPELADTVRRPQRRRQDLRDDRAGASAG